MDRDDDHLLKGEEKSRKRQRCYYGADGKVEKIPIEEAPAAARHRRTAAGAAAASRRRVVENKKDDLRDYMERAAALVHRYIPPDPTLIQQAKDAGTLAVRPLQPGGVRLEFAGYLQPADSFAIDIDGAANRLMAIALATYLEKPDEPITLAVASRRWPTAPTTRRRPPSTRPRRRFASSSSTRAIARSALPIEGPFIMHVDAYRVRVAAWALLLAGGLSHAARGPGPPP